MGRPQAKRRTVDQHRSLHTLSPLSWGRGQALTSERNVLGKMRVMLHEGNVSENKGLLKKEYLFLAQFSHNIHHSPGSWLSASVFVTQQSRPHHCHVPSSSVSEFPFLISFCFLVPPSICVFPLVKFLPPSSVALKNSLFTLPRCRQGRFWELPSLTFTWSNHYWRNPISFTLDGVHSAWGEDGAHISLVPGRSCEGTEHVQSLCVDKQHLLCSTPAALWNVHVHLKDGIYGDISSQNKNVST